MGESERTAEAENTDAEELGVDAEDCDEAADAELCRDSLLAADAVGNIVAALDDEPTAETLGGNVASLVADCPADDDVERDAGAVADTVAVPIEDADVSAESDARGVVLVEAESRAVTDGDRDSAADGVDVPVFTAVAEACDAVKIALSVAPIVCTAEAVGAMEPEGDEASLCVLAILFVARAEKDEDDVDD